MKRIKLRGLFFRTRSFIRSNNKNVSNWITLTFTIRVFHFSLISVPEILPQMRQISFLLQNSGDEEKFVSEVWTNPLEKRIMMRRWWKNAILNGQKDRRKGIEKSRTRRRWWWWRHTCFFEANLSLFIFCNFEFVFVGGKVVSQCPSQRSSSPSFGEGWKCK